LSYQVLARKWRPQRFDEIYGQSHVTSALRSAIRLGRVPHALLLTGPRGVGKTTIARLLARCLNCEKGPTDTPCGTCASCLEIASGASTDVQEIDAASRTSVDDVRELIEAIRYAPSPGKHRIFVVDEVHMLSTPAFNALLKTLEEPPPRSLFVFATTNPEKIPFTVVSRCQRHDLRRLPTDEIAARLREIVAAEDVKISPTSLLAVARAGDGSLRDALTLLDQIIASGGTEVDDARVAAVLDLVDRRLLVGILAACVDGKPDAVLAACAHAADSGIDARRLSGELLQSLRDLVVLRVAPDAAGLVDASDADLAELRALAERIEEARLRRMFRALLREQEDLAWAPQPFAVLEMALVRLATMPAGDDVAMLLARIDALEKRLSAEAGPGSGGGRGPAGGESPRSAPAPRPAPAKPTFTRAEKAAPTPERVEDSEADASLAALDPPGRPMPAAPDEAPGLEPEAESAPLPVVMDRLRGFVHGENRTLAVPLDGGRLLERTADRLKIGVPGGFAATRLQGKLAALEEICARFFGQRMRIEVVVLEAAATSGRAAPEVDDEIARRRRQEALQHPAVNATLEILGGEIVEIRPLGTTR
jgi:DNA polymerase-3 subunit gamma/tau